MKIAYFDCFSGCSGDMLLGAFIDAGFELKALKQGLRSLDLGNYELKAEKVVKSSITATKFDVIINENSQHSHRPLSEILKIIGSSRLSKNIKKKSSDIFQKLGEAEAGIHGISIEDVEFHELGAIDTIVDIVGTLLALEYLGVEQTYASSLPIGSGIIHSAHGILPAPAPATLHLLSEAQAPLVSYPDNRNFPAGELVTPTGAVLLTSLAKFSRPNMQVGKVGYGAGTKDFSGWPNVMRIWLGESSVEDVNGNLVLLETNIDDMSPQIFGYLMDKLLAARAVDVWFTPIQMKKNRPAVMLSVLAPVSFEAQLTDIIMRETTTLGIRSRRVSRQIAQREIIEFKSSLGLVHVKIKRVSGKIQNVSPEYEDCRNIAASNNLPLLEVIRTIESEAGKNLID